MSYLGTITYIKALDGVQFLYLSYISIKLRFKILEKGGVGGRRK